MYCSDDQSRRVMRLAGFLLRTRQKKIACKILARNLCEIGHLEDVGVSGNITL
jgi:hypothetical protein